MHFPLYDPRGVGVLRSHRAVGEETRRGPSHPGSCVPGDREVSSLLQHLFYPLEGEPKLPPEIVSPEKSVIYFQRVEVGELSCSPLPAPGRSRGAGGCVGTSACFCLRVTLNKRQALSLFGNDISPLIMEVEFQTRDRLRFRVSIWERVGESFS